MVENLIKCKIYTQNLSTSGLYMFITFTSIRYEDRFQTKLHCHWFRKWNGVSLTEHLLVRYIIIYFLALSDMWHQCNDNEELSDLYLQNLNICRPRRSLECWVALLILIAHTVAGVLQHWLTRPLPLSWLHYWLINLFAGIFPGTENKLVLNSKKWK